MPSFTIQADTEQPDKWRAYRDGIAIGVAGTYREIEEYLDLLEQGEE